MNENDKLIELTTKIVDNITAAPKINIDIKNNPSINVDIKTSDLTLGEIKELLNTEKLISPNFYADLSVSDLIKDIYYCFKSLYEEDTSTPETKISETINIAKTEKDIKIKDE